MLIFSFSWILGNVCFCEVQKRNYWTFLVGIKWKLFPSNLGSNSNQWYHSKTPFLIVANCTSARSRHIAIPDHIEKQLSATANRQNVLGVIQRFRSLRTSSSGSKREPTQTTGQVHRSRHTGLSKKFPPKYFDCVGFCWFCVILAMCAWASVILRDAFPFFWVDFAVLLCWLWFYFSHLLQFHWLEIRCMQLRRNHLQQVSRQAETNLFA